MNLIQFHTISIQFADTILNKYQQYFQLNLNVISHSVKFLDIATLDVDSVILMMLSTDLLQ